MYVCMMKKEIMITIDNNDDYNNNNIRIVWDSLQFWVPSNVTGTLMMRVNLSKGNPVPFSEMPWVERPNEVIQLWPNPSLGNELHWKCNLPELNRIEIIDGQGRLLVSQKVQSEAGVISLPADITNGIYNIVFYNSDQSLSKIISVVR